FNDADLIGLPVRVTVSERALAQGGVEMKMRREPDKAIVPLEETAARIRSTLDALLSGIEAKVTTVEWHG
ncbi:MAG: hypothetical protein FJZ96_11230, partial [Chloroflexi bacterium]|nr:hypothetical protein [Chloroflexota bacterium]